MADEIILETRNLVKEFKGFVAVNDVNLKVQRGHIHALIGPNGAGKTTFFNLLTKFLIPTRGQILYKGQDITQEKSAQVARQSLAAATSHHTTISVPTASATPLARCRIDIAMPRGQR